MGDGLGEVAKSWLADPPWQKVFKHTFDVIEDYVNYILVAVGGIALSVRLLTTLSTGDLVCIVVGVDSNSSSPGSLDPYPSGSAMGFINYASTDPACIQKVFSPFMEYLPYIMLVQTVILIVVEKFTFKIPRIAQRVERFYQNIVEQSLFGKDPDVAEDMYDPKTSTEAISRRRQRNEICVTLKRSSIIHDVYIGKNCIEVLLVFLFLLVDIQFYIEEKPSDFSQCRLPVKAFPGGAVEEEGFVLFQCHGKKMNFFIMMLMSQIVLLGIHGICSSGSILWCIWFRSVTRLLQTIESMKRERGTLIREIGTKDGKDFLFLFDLLSHTCGLESTLRVLTHSDETFYEICRPTIVDQLTLEEDKLKIVWRPADIERWLQTGKQVSNTQRAIEIDSYEVTIFPAESVKNTHTLGALSRRGNENWDKKTDEELCYHTWFYDLHGGRTEYVITIACMIGKSRMKGEKVVTTLVPYGPEKPRSGMVKMAGTDQVEIFWDPPKGEFTKYFLKIDQILSSKELPKQESILRLNSVYSYNKSNNNSVVDLNVDVDPPSHMKRVMENLSSKLTTYTILGLEPGESYQIELGTKTGNVSTRQSIKDIILTKPETPKNVRWTELTTTTCTIAWVRPLGHTCLKGYQIHVKSADGKTFKDLAVSKMVKQFQIMGLMPACDYEINITSLCQSSDGKRTESEPFVLGNVATQPEKVRNLRLDNSTPTSIAIKWDAPVVSTNYKYKVSISGKTPSAVNDDEPDSLDWAPTNEAGDVPMNPDQARVKISDYASTIEVPGDKTQFTFSKLPEIVGTGHSYTIEVVVVATTSKEAEVYSDPSSGVFVTRPLAPTNLRIDTKRPRAITFYKSMTPSVSKYRIKWRPAEESVNPDASQKVEEAFLLKPSVEDPYDNNLSFSFQPTLIVGAVYKVNVYAIVEMNNQTFESKELHEKIQVKSINELTIYTEEPKE